MICNLISFFINLLTFFIVVRAHYIHKLLNFVANKDVKLAVIAVKVKRPLHEPFLSRLPSWPRMLFSLRRLTMQNWVSEAEWRRLDALVRELNQAVDEVEKGGVKHSFGNRQV